ncbi:MAG: glycoside hydrolase family 2 [Bryobacterales bacterium]|nr:glycoside hydrolase family 2 [Bryobacterales bacterium]
MRFGIREITYELSLLDHSGSLRRVEFSPTAAKGEAVVGGSHEGILQSAEGWVASLRAGAEVLSAIHALDDKRASPYLVIRVNGVRIACKGGNWGIDDSRKRVSREHLEPFFRLHREANLNIIRNWVGQNTEEVFYDLADEYGLLVWNDFWDSTQTTTSSRMIPLCSLQTRATPYRVSQSSLDRYVVRPK